MKTAIFLLGLAGLQCMATQATAEDAAISLSQTVKAQKAASLPKGFEPAEWSGVAAYDIQLTPQKMVPPGGGSDLKVKFQAVHDGLSISARLSWPDASGDTLSELSGRWGDAAALQFPMAGESQASALMGHQGAAVNIWRWSALGQTPKEKRYPKAYSDWDRPRTLEKFMPGTESPAENLLAEGFGSLTRQEPGSLTAQGRYKDGSWIVVITRSLADAQGVVLRQGESTLIAFAIWNGSMAERNGSKSISIWQTLVIE